MQPPGAPSQSRRSSDSGDPALWDDPWRRRRAITFALAAATSFLFYLHRYTWNLIRPELEKEYGMSNTQLETIGSMFYLPYALGQIPGGLLCDLVGPHLFLFAIILIWSVLLPLHIVTGNVGALATIRGAFGFTQAGCYPALSKVTRSWFPPSHRTQIQGWIASAFGRGGGAMASIIMGTVLMGGLGMSWRAALVTLSLVGVAFAFVFLFAFRNSPATDESIPLPQTPEEASEEATGSRADGAEAREVTEVGDLPEAAEPPRAKPSAKAVRSYVVLLFQQFMNAGSDVVFVLLMGSYFKSLGAEGAQLGLLISLPLWGGAAGGIFGGYANDWMIRRINRRWARSSVAGSGLAIGGTLVLASVTLPGAMAVGIGLMVAKFFVDWSQPAVWGTCTDIGGRFSATVFGMNNMLGNLGAFFTPLVVGVLLDAYAVPLTGGDGAARQTDYVPAFMLCGGMMYVAAFCWLFIDCTKPLVPDEEMSGRKASDTKP